MENKRPLRIALIGCGRIGNRHANHISSQAELVAVCDIDEASRKALASEYNCPEYASLEDFINAGLKVDLVSICTPNGLHSAQSIVCLEAGYHVLCEKPLGIDVYQCGEMLKAAEKSNKRLFAIKQNRFNPCLLYT
jgi:predicted dehydrogenase